MSSFQDAIANKRLAPEPYVASRRTESRQPLGAAEARLFVGRRSYVVDLLNLSGGGAMIRSNLPLKLMKPVQLELGESGLVDCVVRWIREDRIGLEFAHETQVGGDAARRDAMLLATIARHFPELAEATLPDEPQRRAELRHPLIWSGTILNAEERTPVRLRNISDHGAMVDCPRAFAEGAEVRLDLAGGGEHDALVTWSRGDQLGLRFRQRFDIACLALVPPEVAPQSWLRPDDLSAGQDIGSPWAEPWQRLPLPELRAMLEGLVKP